MKPHIDGTAFGSITIEGHVFGHDVVVRRDGSVEKRKKKLSKKVYGTSHVMSVAEAVHVMEKGATHVIVGTGQSGVLRLSDDAADYFAQKRIAVTVAPTPQAIELWNRAGEGVIGVFHVTC